MSWRETLRPKKAVRASTVEPMTLMPVPMRPPMLAVAATSVKVSTLFYILLELVTHSVNIILLRILAFWKI